jgi:MFS family permease
MSRPQTGDAARAAQPAGGVLAADGTAGPPRYALPLAFGLQVAISAGDGLAMVALAVRVYQGAHASWAVAAVFLAISLPITALAPVAGLLLDRLPVRPVLVTAAVAQAVVALALTEVSGIGAVLGLAAGFGVCAAVLQPGLGAIVPQLVGPMGVTRANGYLQAATWGGFTIGPLLAGGLAAVGGTGLALAGVSAVYALGALGLTVLPLVPSPAQTGLPEAGAGWEGRAAGQPGTATQTRASTRGGLVSQLGAGVRFLRSDRDAGLLVLVVGVMVGFGNMAVVAEVAFAEGVLRAGPTGYAALVAAWTAGMLAGTLVGGRLPRSRLRHARRDAGSGRGRGPGRCGRILVAGGGRLRGGRAGQRHGGGGDPQLPQSPGARRRRGAGLRGVLRGAVRDGVDWHGRGGRPAVLAQPAAGAAGGRHGRAGSGRPGLGHLRPAPRAGHCHSRSGQIVQPCAAAHSSA